MLVVFNLPVEDFEAASLSLNIHGATIDSVSPHLEAGAPANSYLIALTPTSNYGIMLRILTGQPCDSGGVCTADGTTLSAVPAPLIIMGENAEPSGTPQITGTAQVGETLTADTSGIADQDGLTDVSFSYQWTRSEGTTHADIPRATGSTYLLVKADENKTIKVRVSFTDDIGNDEELTSPATAQAVPKPSTPATGAPTISGTAQVGETLTVDTSGIADAEGLTKVSYAYQWVRSNGVTSTDITGATGTTYVLTTPDEGKTIQVTVSFEDDLGNPEELTSAATAAVTAATGDSPVWGATMTAAPVYTDHGYSSFDGFRYGDLTTKAFSIDEDIYWVNVIEASGWIYIGFDKEIPTDFTLDVDGTKLDSTNASLTSYSYTKMYEWSGAGIDWSNGRESGAQAVRLHWRRRLTKAPTQRTRQKED